VVDEVADWEELREAGRTLKAATMARLPELLEQLEERVSAAGGRRPLGPRCSEANRIVTDLVRATGADEVVKVKSMATQEIGLNEALEEAGIAAFETDLAELIVQLGHDKPSHILVPAIHRNRTEIRDIFLREMDDVPPVDRRPTRSGRGRPTPPASQVPQRTGRRLGANFAVAETGTLAVVESEGNGRMCLTLPRTLITVMGIEKLVPAWTDLEVFLQLLPRSSTGERMNPYTSMWTGVTPGDGPRSSTWCCWTTVGPPSWPTRWAARRCTASAARPASTSARSTSGRAGMPTGRSTPALSAPSCPRSSPASPVDTGPAAATTRFRTRRRCAVPAMTYAR
jgi:L-lactate dehydrogenase complex protein LldF